LRIYAAPAPLAAFRRARGRMVIFIVAPKTALARHRGHGFS
jgi:hypothetical protein